MGEGRNFSLFFIGKKCKVYLRSDVAGERTLLGKDAIFLLFLLAKSVRFTLGTGKVNRSDEFSEKFQTAFDPPPPHFRKVTLRFSRQNCDKSAYVHMEEHLCIL